MEKNHKFRYRKRGFTNHYISVEDFIEIRFKKLLQSLTFVGAVIEYESPEKITIKPWIEATSVRELRACGSVWVQVIHILNREKHFWNIPLVVFGELSTLVEESFLEEDDLFNREDFLSDPFLFSTLELPLKISHSKIILDMNKEVVSENESLSRMGYRNHRGLVRIPCSRLIQIVCRAT